MTNNNTPTVVVTFGGTAYRKPTICGDLQDELKLLCESQNLTMETTVEGAEIMTADNQVFDWDVITKYKCETQSFTDHYLRINGENDAGNPSASRYAKNLRLAIKMLKSGDQLLKPCDTKNCDYCK
jgi:hypothetical protein